jgi:hypothetical protein
MPATLQSLKRRLARLEQVKDSEADQARDWRWRFMHWLRCKQAEAGERELDWLIPSFFQSLLADVSNGWPHRLGPTSPFAVDADFAALWGRWMARYDSLQHEVCMFRLTPEQGPRHPFDFWTPRADGEQEALRGELVRRMRSILATQWDFLHDCLPDQEGKSLWRPSSPATVDTRPPHSLVEPKSLYYRWCEEEQRKRKP